MKVLSSSLSQEGQSYGEYFQRDNSLGLLGVNYRSAPLSLRESAARELERNQSKLLQARKEGIIRGAAVVSTCNRAEVLFSAEPQHFDQIHDFLREEIFDFSSNSSKSFGKDASDAAWYFFKDDKVPEHLFRVATGLDSMITGEAQILGQLKSAYHTSVKEGLIESSLHRLFQSAFRTAKLVRSSTGIGKGTVSIASASKLAVESIFGDLASLKYLVIGAGETARLISRYMRDAGATSFFIANRTISNSRNLSAMINGVNIPLSKITEVLPMVDVVISAISMQDGDEYILNFETLNKIIENERSRSYVLLDVSVPRSIDPRVQEIPSVYLFDIDDFKSVSDAALELRQKEVDRADSIIQDEVLRYRQWQKERTRYFMIRELVNKFQTESAREWIRTSRKLRAEGMSDESLSAFSDVINRHQESVFSRFMHPVFESLRDISSEEAQVRVQELFSLSEKPPLQK